MGVILAKSVPVDGDVVGLEWTISDFAGLAVLVAVIALGQAQHAADIIADLQPGGAAYIEADLIDDAKAQMVISGSTPEQRKAARQRRDGFLFECISWIAARQAGDDRTFLKDPHLDATTHGLDGLVLQLAPKKAEILNATICEDKCTSYPRKKFRGEVLRTFAEHHRNKRARDLVANAAELIRDSGLRGTAAVLAASRVTEKDVRSYRAALTTTSLGKEGRQKLFAGYNELDGITQAQRIGAMMPLDEPLRDWFQKLAEAVIHSLEDFMDTQDEEGVNDV